MNLDLQWDQTPDQVVIKDVPLPYQGDITISITNTTIRVTDVGKNVILQGITFGDIKDWRKKENRPGFFDLYLIKERAGEIWGDLFREEVDPGVYISEVVAIGNYTAEEPIELTIRKGDVIKVISKDSEPNAWWKGKCKDKVGFFPSNYVREFPATPQTTPPAAPKKTVQPGAQVVQPGVQVAQPVQAKATNPQARQPNTVAGSPKTNQVAAKATPDVVPVVAPQPTTPKTSAAPSGAKRPTSNADVKPAGPKIPISETLRPRRTDAFADAATPVSVIEIIGICKTTHEYEPKDSNANELSFGVGEYIYIIEKDESGWWKGESSTNNVIGWFGQSYVEELSEDAAREMFQMNEIAELKEEPTPPQPERKRTYSSSFGENPKRTSAGSPKIEMKGGRSEVQIHDPQPLNTSGTIKKDLDSAKPKVVDLTGQKPATDVKVERPASGLSGGHRNSGGFPNVSTPTVVSVPETAPRVNATPSPVKVNTNPTSTTPKTPLAGVAKTGGATLSTTTTPNTTPVKTNVTATPAVENTQPKPSGKFAAITAAMQEVYNSVKAMKPSATWQKCTSDPYLGLQDTNKFAAAFCSVTGETFSIGDSNVNFPLSDIAWPLLFLMMREKLPAKVTTAFKVKEPTAYVVGLCDRALQNPFYFPGAYTMCSWLTEMPGVKYPWDRVNAVLNYTSALMQGYDAKNNNQFVSEGGSNISLQCSMADYLSIRACFGKIVNMGTFLKEQNIVTTSVDVKELTDIFNQVHSIESNTNILAVIAANLANDGKHILTKASLVPSECVQETLGYMSACGLNNDSKDWQATVGLPAKSSQAGVIMAVIPNVGGLVVYAPALNVFGNSAKGTEFFKQLVQKIPDLKK